ncbi:MAG: Alpha/beta hydrolase family protein [Actinobacteria bacterium ADurb.Bin346]|nr:MAG: Alpha/beta hydrolase family protein [Actinobacteria bacterium ADurb.Bin346]
MTENIEKDKKRRQLYVLLGELPSFSRKITAKKLRSTKKSTYILEELLLDLNGLEEVPAYFIKPRSAANKKYPVVLYNHSHGGNYLLGKDELIKGNVYLQNPPYADVLAEKGYASLCIDCWAFGKRQGRTESEIFKYMLWNGQVMWGMMVYDSIRAIDYLHFRDDIDTGRIAAMGISMGSTMSWWLAALDTRIKVCIDMCCLTEYKYIIDNKGLDLHGIYYYVPGLLKYFTAAQINALISPRPHLALEGRHDPLTPVEGLYKIDKELKIVYKKDNAPADAWTMKIYDTGHNETPEMRKEILSFLKKWL